jgi:hypothetical protein
MPGKSPGLTYAPMIYSVPERQRDSNTNSGDNANNSSLD